ncbi:MAG: hypothetical protein CBB65_02340 [Hyphomonadaceae bacterium TMED5]|nr:MAG: hypothetical protein CBB65_02340 [Hyphomonadaceae bacterium TMED5]|tara:strand:+ start:42033 stop:42521 length:489 start_codon:yes stop_codon:yes gene_type:complete
MQVGTDHNLDADVLRAANISPDTLLATDFLNHYNEVAMLVDFLGSDDEISEEVLSWKPESYVDHFTHSGFRDKELAIEAFCQADADLVSRFEKACNALDQKIIAIQQAVIKSDFDAAGEIGRTLFDDIGAINGLIVGDGPSQTHIDPTDSGISQSDIDNLFG